jgi:large subunit ribosomal protein L31
MRTKIHPDYTDTTITCACGASFETRSTSKGDAMRVDICSHCHPFYTGQQKLLDTAGRVEKFTKKFGGDYFSKKPAKGAAASK